MADGYLHLRRRDVALFGQGALLFSLQSHSAAMDFVALDPILGSAGCLQGLRA
jgi:hypothetical protein